MNISVAKQLFLLDRKAKGLSEKTILDYSKSLKKFEDETKVVNVEDIDKMLIESWIQQNSDLKPVTMNKYLRDVRCFVYFLMENELTNHNFKVKLLKKQESLPKYYTDEEVANLLNSDLRYHEFIDDRTYTMICVALGTGARLSTILNIKQSDIDWTNGILNYSHTKNKLSACVPISSKLMIIIKKFLLEYDIKEEWVFPDVCGGQLSTEGAYRALVRYCDSRGVARHSWHSFRHTFAKTWVLQGGDVVRLQVMLQHSSLDQTQQYCRIFGTDLKDTAKFTALETIPQGKKHKYK